MEENYSQRLKEVLFLLASPVSVQINVFPQFVHIPDEIVSETSDAIEFATNELSIQDSSILATLRKIDEVFDAMGGDINNWTVENIKVNPIWQNVRLLAQEEIDRQQLSYKKPELFWLSYFNE